MARNDNADKKSHRDRKDPAAREQFIAHQRENRRKQAAVSEIDTDGKVTFLGWTRGI